MVAGVVEDDAGGMTTHTAPTPTSSYDSFLAKLRASGFTRSSADRRIAGVCSGIAHKYGVEPIVVRLGFIAALFLGISVLVYPILWVLMPSDRDGRIILDDAKTKKDTKALILVGLLTLAVLGSIFGHHEHGFWPALVVAGIAWMMWSKRGRGCGPRHRHHDDRGAGSTSSTPTDAPTDSAGGPAPGFGDLPPYDPRATS